MSVFKRAQSQFYQFDFVIQGRRFLGSTKATTKKEALAAEARAKDQARSDLKIEKERGEGPLTIDVAAGRYYEEKGQHHVNHMDTWRALERLIKFFGPGKRMADISDSDVAELVAWRRKQKRWGKAKYKDDRDMPAVSNATVNRDTTAVLKKLFMRARRTWKIQLPNEPEWRDHWLKESAERVRELHEDEGEALDAAVRADYAPWLEFARLTGLRLAETLIKWSDVNLFARRITVIGKSGRTVSTPITPEVYALLEPLRGDHPDYVFTYVARRNRTIKPKDGGKPIVIVKGKRYPITYEGAKTQWQRLRGRSKVQDFRFHDIRHDVATKTLRETGNLKITQRVLNHTSLKTTSRYAHVLDQDVADALAAVAKSRRNPRSSKKDVA